MTSTPPLRWFLAQFKPNCGSIAERNLMRQGFRTFLPLERKTRRHRDRLSSVKSPYFPGYMFVGVDAHASPWRAIHSTYGISRLVSFGLQPAPVPPKIMEELLGCCDPDGCIENLSPLSEGDAVQVRDGPLASFTGKIEKLATNERAWLLIDIMGKATRSLVRRGDVRRSI